MERSIEENEEIIANLKEIMPFLLRQADAVPFSSFLCMDKNRSSNIHLPVRNSNKIHIDLDALDLDDVELDDIALDDVEF